MKLLLAVLVLYGTLAVINTSSISGKLSLKDEEEAAAILVEDIDIEISKLYNIGSLASWKYECNITEENLKLKNEVSEKNAKYAKDLAKKLLKYRFTEYQSEDLKRKFYKLTSLGYAALSEEKYKELNKVLNDMDSNYSTGKLCSLKDRTKCDIEIEPDLYEIFATSRDPEELKYYWVEWYNKAGAPVRDSFFKYIELTRESAILNNYTSLAEQWLSEYEDETIEEQLEHIFTQIRPLYLQIHAYVRHRLREYYGDIVSADGPIPMHLLGNMWAQQWDDIADFASPYPHKQQLDVTEEMNRQGYTAHKIFQMGDAFFQSMNMTKLPQKFWDNSILEKPNDGRELVCHASAWDFFEKDDVRIKMCTRITMDEFFTACHELGHIQYYLQYQHLPAVYREGANPGFHEAVGDVIALSVSTPKHLKRIGLLKDYEEDEEAKINQFFRSGLAKFVFLPFAYTIDKYRWGLFRGDIKPEEANCKFWQLRDEYSGIEPPVVRTEKDFDAPAKYHVSADVEYLRYLISYIVQFQFHKAACIKAGEFVPGDSEKTLNNCDIYQSPEAGNAFKAMLSMGSSKPWPDAMEALTGQRKMDAGPLLEYFKPLHDWLLVRNKEINAHIGWTKSKKCVSSS